MVDVHRFYRLEQILPQRQLPPRENRQIVDSTTGCEMMVLLDCFSGYHQIWLHKVEEEKISFIIPFETYCYLRMLEGLRNAGSTFCRMMKTALKDQVRRNVLSYVDGIVVASRKKDAYISDLAETFTNMHEARHKLNPKNVYLGLQGARFSAA
jgi:hypothetical protein